MRGGGQKKTNPRKRRRESTDETAEDAKRLQQPVDDHGGVVSTRVWVGVRELTARSLTQRSILTCNNPFHRMRF